MKEYTSAYTKQIFSELIPLTGSIVAQSILKTLAIRIGKTEDSLAIEDRPKIVEGLEKGLVVFLGSETAKMVASKIGQIK